MIYILFYITGFMFSLTFFKLYGKKIGFDYDLPHDDYHDDWDSNAQAYTWFSFFWFVIIPILTVIGVYKLISMFTHWYLKSSNE